MRSDDNVLIEGFVVGPLGANCYVVYDAGSGKGLLVDPGAYDPAIDEFIKDSGLDIKFTVNTHGHVDHIAANGDFRYPVAIHELDAESLTDPWKNLSMLTGQTVKPGSPDRLLVDGDILELGGTMVRVIHTPGHSPGSISLLVGEEILISGDTLFREGVGRTDLPGGDQDAITRSIADKLYVLPDKTRVFPGHGPSTSIGYEKEHNPFI
ncbi:MAG: MBL fold metallo-hydrolase [Candidatus Omnitrophica bacterium]|nr:MBL fold metallo-hydrolase [Candidatus Omnitrophota bacterium]MDD5488666.1 MBL fold metallo-hydrolase [Candidatus Omnitrophota bacterium]